MAAKKVSLIWVVAAGTGGHIFPGLNLARALKSHLPHLDLLFFGSRDRLEAELVPRAGYPIQFLLAGRWKGRGVLGRLLGFLYLGLGFVQSCMHLSRRRPDLLISVGGYVSFPLAVACRLRGVPIFLVEPNIRAGLANRVISRWARLAFSTPGSDATQALKCPVVEAGNPIREDLRPVKIRPQPRRVLVLGGSQGARSLCQIALKAFAELNMSEQGVELCLQSGQAHLADFKEQIRILGWEQKGFSIFSFIDDIPQALSQADFVVARAGAMTVAELAATGLPTLFVPFPHAADDHQRVNAQLLAQKGAALCVDEREEGFEAKTMSCLRAHLFEEGQEARREELSKKFLNWARPQAARDIAARILELS